MPASPLLRALLGFIAAALSVLIFHQGMVGALHALAIPGLEIARTPYNLAPIPPFGVPALASLCFWAGLYGAAFGLVAPRLTLPFWLAGLLTGVIAVLVGMFLVAAIKGNPIAGGWVWNNWVRGLLINGCWGLGLGLIYPMLAPRRRPAPG